MPTTVTVPYHTQTHSPKPFKEKGEETNEIAREEIRSITAPQPPFIVFNIDASLFSVQ